MQSRNFGLDVLRAAAILFVLINHIFNYFITFNRSTILGDISGSFGVELFFVLSGFLIGRILLSDFSIDVSRAHIKRFYLRRWFRTLPLYYFLLIIFIFLTAYATSKPDPHVWHFIFLQNFFPLDFFSVSWSLAIEEWFYFLLPIILFFGYKLKLFTKQSLFFLIILIISLMCMRFVYVILFEPSFDEVRKSVFFRFDSLLIGVLFAGIKMHMSDFYEKLQKTTWLFIAFVFMLGMGYIYTLFFERGFLDTSLPARVFAFPFLSLLIALTIPFFEKSLFINAKLYKVGILRDVIIWTSLLSYSLYLVHLSIFDGVRGIFGLKGPVFIMLPLALIMTVFVSYLLYRYIEKPFMRMREKFK